MKTTRPATPTTSSVSAPASRWEYVDLTSEISCCSWDADGIGLTTGSKDAVALLPSHAHLLGKVGFVGHAPKGTGGWARSRAAPEGLSVKVECEVEAGEEWVRAPTEI